MKSTITKNELEEKALKNHYFAEHNEPYNKI